MVAALSCLLLAACASMQHRDPLRVTVAGVEPLKGEGMEMRLAVKLRVQNPNEAPVDFRGVSLEMDVEGKGFASGVCDESGTVPGFGESVITVPVSISALHMARQALTLLKGGEMDKIRYELKGKLGAGGTGGTRFGASGEFELPTAAPAATKAVSDE
jgi:LEA14-like dessication related protein